jgi:hypothetical protein
MRPAKAAPAVLFAYLPLCQHPNVCVSNHRGILARWYHTNPPCLITTDILRLGWIAVKVLEAAPIVERINEVNSLGRLFRRGGCRLCVADGNAKACTSRRGDQK